MRQDETESKSMVLTPKICPGLVSYSESTLFIHPTIRYEEKAAADSHIVVNVVSGVARNF